MATNHPAHVSLAASLVDEGSSRSRTDDSGLLKDADVASMLGVEVSTVRSWRSRGGGPTYFRITKQAPRYRRSDVVAFIEARRVVPGSRG